MIGSRQPGAGVGIKWWPEFCIRDFPVPWLLQAFGNSGRKVVYLFDMSILWTVANYRSFNRPGRDSPTAHRMRRVGNNSVNHANEPAKIPAEGCSGNRERIGTIFEA